VQSRFTKRLQDYGGYSYEKRLQLLSLQKLEIREYGLTRFGAIKLYLVWYTLPLSSSLSSGLALHPFKLYKRYNSCGIRSLFFTERVINIWNKLPVSIIDLLPTKHGHNIWMSKSAMFGDIFLHN